MTTHYIQHETTGTVHSVDEANIVDALAVPGWSEIDEEAAREAAPTEFGAPNPLDIPSHDGYGNLVDFDETGRPFPVAPR